jgi:hypothetical protein
LSRRGSVPNLFWILFFSRSSVTARANPPTPYLFQPAACCLPGRVVLQFSQHGIHAIAVLRQAAVNQSLARRAGHWSENGYAR